MHYRYRLVFLICINITQLIYIAIGCIMRYVFSLRWFKQMDAHMRARADVLHIHVRASITHTRAPAFIHSF